MFRMFTDRFLARTPRHSGPGFDLRRAAGMKCMRVVTLGALPLAVCLAIVLGACDVRSQALTQPAKPSTQSAATGTTVTQPTLVELTLQVQEEGTVIAHTAQLIVTTTVTNHTSDVVGLAYQSCFPVPPIIFRLVTSNGRTVWQQSRVDNCVMTPVYDVLKLAPHASHQWSITLNLPGATDLPPGTYSLVASNLLWHQGDISPTGETSSLHGLATGQTTLTLQ